MKLHVTMFATTCAVILATACSGTDATPDADIAEEPIVGTATEALVTSQAQYLKNAQGGIVCNVTADILIKEPDGPGPFPVFIYTGGANETGPNGSDFTGSTVSIVTEAARQGFVAAAIDYEDSANGLFGPCTNLQLHDKARCVYSASANVQSAVGVLCARPKAGCGSLGIVTAGFSEGGSIAALGRNFDARVRGTWSMGFADVDAFQTAAPCFDQGTAPLGATNVRLLSNSRLRLTSGVNQGTALLAYNRTTGRNCAAGTNNCLNGPNASGWKLALASELGAGNPAQHCFLFNSVFFDCTGTGVDAVFARIPPATTFASGSFQNISWLRNTIVPLGPQP